MIGILAIIVVALIPVLLFVALLGLVAGFVGSLAERDLGVGLFADENA
jgi:uncharacterized oligopeptide transporter (OPT) family protein